MVELAEPVQLIPLYVQDEGVVDGDRFRKMHGMGFVQLEDRDIVVEGAVGLYFFQDRRQDAAYEITAGFVGEDPEALLFEQLGYDLGGGGLSVGAGYDGDAKGQRRKDLS